jgi:hypothetical protein
MRPTVQERRGPHLSVQLGDGLDIPEVEVEGGRQRIARPRLLQQVDCLSKTEAAAGLLGRLVLVLEGGLGDRRLVARFCSRFTSLAKPTWSAMNTFNTDACDSSV